MSADELCESLMGGAETRSDVEVHNQSGLRPQEKRDGSSHASQTSKLNLQREQKARIRTKSPHIAAEDRKRISAIRDFDNNFLVLSPEGMGKTKALFDAIADESLDAAMSVEREKRQFALHSAPVSKQQKRHMNTETQGNIATLFRS